MILCDFSVIKKPFVFINKYLPRIRINIVQESKIVLHVYAWLPINQEVT